MYDAPPGGSVPVQLAPSCPGSIWKFFMVTFKVVFGNYKYIVGNYYICAMHNL